MSFPRSPFTSRLGLQAGRLAPTSWTPTDGDYAFVLGSDVPGVVRTIDVGDFVEASVIGDLQTGSTNYLRLKLYLRPASSVPVGCNWRASVRLDGVELFGQSFTTGLGVELFDVAIPTHAIGTTRSVVSVQLLLQGAAGTYEVELPGLYIDSGAMVEETARPILINRVPSPGSSNVPVDSSIRLTISDPLNTAIGLGPTGLGGTPTSIWVNDVLAYDGNAGGVQAGFDGADAVNITGNVIGPTIVLDPLVPFESQTLVSVRVQTRRSTGDPIILEYSFLTEDITAPRPIEALGTGRRTVRVTFSEDLVPGDGTGTSDALNPANWSLQLLSTSLDDGLPAVLPTVESVVQLGSAQYELQLDIELTALALYQVSVENVVDLVGNVVTPPVNVALFYGYQCPPPAGRDFDLFDMLPQLNRDEDETRELEAFMRCLQEVTDHLLCDIDEWTDILDPDIAPERFVDAMLADLGNPFAFDLTEIDKRRLIHVLVPIYKQKGTDPGIINAVRFFLGVEVTIRVPAFEGVWLLGIGELGVDSILGSDDLRTRLSFWIDSPIVLTDEQRERIAGIAEYMKRAETHLLGITEPSELPADPDHWELGLSELGSTTLLH